MMFVIGCTASGKGALGRALARRTGGEILSVDSMKVYRRMDIGTAKPSREMRVAIEHHLIDVVEPSEPFSVAQYVERAERAIAAIAAGGRPVIAVGGTPLYIRALTQGLFDGPGADAAIRTRLHEQAEREGAGTLHERLVTVDPVAARRIHPNDLRRIVRALEVFELTGRPISELQTQWEADKLRHPCVFVGIRRPRDQQSKRINERVHRMIEAGLVSEVQSLLAEDAPMSATARRALGYAEIIECLTRSVSLADATEKIKINTRRLAKSQRTWFKRIRETEWIDVTGDDSADQIADDLVKRRGKLWSATPR